MRIVKNWLVSGLVGLATKKSRFLLLGLAVLTLIAIWFPGNANAQNYRFSTVTVEGNQRVDTDTIINYTSIERGETVSAGQLNDAYQAILESGLFETAEVDPQGSRLVIKVKEFPTISKIAFEGNKKIENEDLLGFIESSPRQVFSPTQAERDAAVITEAYAQNGRISARVTPRVIRRSDNRVDLVFEIFEGDDIEVQRISFVGNKQFSDRRLRRAIGSKQAGLLRAFIARDAFVQDRLEFDQQVLNDFYQSRGYVDFRVTGTNAELAGTRDTYFITFNIQEGQQFKFGEITTVSEIDGADADEFNDVMKIRPGVVYSPTLVESSIARMERLAVDKGIDFLQVEPRITRNDRDLTLDLELALTRAPRVFIERIDIEGNTTTLDRVIRRQFDAVEGDPFNPRQIREAADRIRFLQFFGDVDVDAREGSRPDQVIIDVDVEETTTGTLSFGGSFSTNAGLGILLGFSERNFVGRGQTLRATFSGTASDANYALNFIEPAFLGRDVALGLDFSLLQTNDDFSRFDTITGVFRPSLTFPVSENSRLSVFYNARYTDISDFTGASDIIASEVAQGGLFASGVGYNYTYDTRRTGLNPNAGVLLSFGQELAGVGGQRDFVTTTVRAIAQTRIFGEDLLLRASAEGGALTFFGGQNSRAVERFSGQIIRGFEPNGIGPVEGIEELGGDYFAAIKFEAEFPIGLPEEYGISGGAFYDIGAIWGVDTDAATGPGSSGLPLASTGFNDRHVIGLSVFWESPFGPLRLNFSRALKSENSDTVQNFDFAVRTDF